MKQDNQINLPSCSNPKCNSINPCRLYINGQLLCGDCVMKIHKASQQQMMNFIEG